jgi:hypothetical protein
MAWCVRSLLPVTAVAASSVGERARCGTHALHLRLAGVRGRATGAHLQKCSSDLPVRIYRSAGVKKPPALLLISAARTATCSTSTGTPRSCRTPRAVHVLLLHSSAGAIVIEYGGTCIPQPGGDRKCTRVFKGDAATDIEIQ